MSSQLNCGTGSSIVKTDSFSSTDGPLMGAVDPPCNPSSSDSRPTPLSQEPSSSTHNKTLTHSVHSASSLTNGLAHGHSRSKKANHIGMLRMKNFQDFLNESSPGVEI
ncbi:hypothetical protein EB796_012653 [Bugula neritina]|uniref:Uncharacterized protein n=1 Tax=Bugula neritina TaxID=10212 RepID=A0A7J7JT09_BUGNE|nr:hypothetical protein EB796_012653 [Bugula neritina]